MILHVEELKNMKWKINPWVVGGQMENDKNHQTTLAWKMENSVCSQSIIEAGVIGYIQAEYTYKQSSAW